jgi:ligand-binding sensor domain-containing protein
MLRGNKNDSLPIRFEPFTNGLIPNEKGEIDIKQTTASPTGDLYVAAKTGIFYLANHADTWIDITGDLPAEKAGQRPDTEGIYPDPHGRLWAGSKKVGLFFSSDPMSGIWVSPDEQLPAGKSREIICITSASGDSTRLYVGTKEGTFTKTIPLQTNVSNWRLWE